VNLVVAFAGIVAGLVVWWLAVRQLTTRSWEGQGTFDGRDSAGPAGLPPERVGLWIFLAVVTSFFALFIAAYAIRMSPPPQQGVLLRDWRPLAEPPVLWVNTALLLAGSLGMQFARRAIAVGQLGRARSGMLAGGAFAIAFLAGQLLAWRQLQSAGYYAAGNPANAFFYVLTGLHGLHLVGGLVVLGRTAVRMSGPGASPGAVRLAIELCTVYWHYLFVVWLVLFGLLLIT
jgi:cytochrome c oxidase subunit III